MFPIRLSPGSTEVFKVDKEKVLEVYNDVLQSTEE